MSFIIPSKEKGFKIPTKQSFYKLCEAKDSNESLSRIGFKPNFDTQENKDFKQTEQESSKSPFEQKSLNFAKEPYMKINVLKPFWLMMLLEPEIDVQDNIISLRVMKAFKRESTEDKAKHQKQKKSIETLDSFVDDDELI